MLTALLMLSSQVFAQVEPSSPGPWSYGSLSSGLQSSSYKDAIVYAPEGDGPFPAVTLVPGYTNVKEDIAWLGKLLASHGIISLVFTPTNNYSLNATTWATGHLGGLQTLEKLNANPLSPLFGKVNTEKLGVIGYSFGGAGSLIASEQASAKVKAVVAINAYRPLNVTTDAAALFLAGTRDNVANSSLIRTAFDNLDTTSPKAFANINGMNHYNPLKRLPAFHKEISELIVPWLKVFLSEEPEFETYFNGDIMNEILSEGRLFARPSDYIYSAP